MPTNIIYGSANATGDQRPSGSQSTTVGSQHVPTSQRRRRQGVYWLLTIPYEDWQPVLDENVAYLRGQLERGNDTGYIHWQVLVVFKRKQSLSGVKRIFGRRIHGELAVANEAAHTYVWKDDTCVDPSTRFELGAQPVQRNSRHDWDAIRSLAQSGQLDAIPSDVYIRCFRNLQAIRQEHLQPVANERFVTVLWGGTGLGKSHRAWEEAGLSAFPKDPRTKYWDGYRDHQHVVIDEFRGGIDIAHVLRWFDKYPVIVEIKGSSTVLMAERIWITSNIHPREWYPGLDGPTLEALLRRLKIIHFVGFNDIVFE